MKPIRIGLIGAARIARSAIIAPVKTNPDFEIVALAARNIARATVFAKEHNIPVVAESYRALLARDDVDLVYIALPPAYHAKWCIEALRSGKDVLCEKPFSMNVSQAQQMVATAKQSGRMLLEAFHYRHHPCIARAIEIANSAAFGAITAIDAGFEVPIAYDANELRWHAELGGGALFDLGCYCIHVMRAMVGTEPEVLSAQSRLMHGVDETTIAVLRFPDGPLGRVRASMSSSSFRAELTVTGENGVLKLTNFVAPHLGGRLQVAHGDMATEEESSSLPTYSYQLAHVAEVIRRGQTPLISGTDSIANMAALEAIRRAAKEQPPLD